METRKGGNLGSRRGTACVSILMLLLAMCFAFGGSITGTVVVRQNMTVPSISTFNATVDQGQYIVFNANVIGGTSPYSYNYIIVNSVTLAPIANMLSTNSYQSNAFAWFPSVDFVGNTVKANVIVTDSYPTTLNSLYSSIVMINSAPAATLDASSNNIESGNSVTFTVNIIGGTGPFVAELYDLTNGHQLGTNVIISSSSGNGNTISAVVSAPSTATFKYDIITTDKGTTTPYVFNSAILSIQIHNSSSRSGGGGSTGGGGGFGGGGSIRPTASTLQNGCILITNVSVPNSFDISLNGSIVRVTESYISSNFTSIIANGQTYVLYPGNRARINDTSIYIELLNVSYLPILHTVSFEACSSNIQTTSIVSKIPTVSFTSLPIYTELLKGTTSSLQLGLEDPTSGLETVNIAIGTGYSDIASLSATNVRLLPGQSTGIELTLTAQQYLNPGTYVIPILLTVNGSGGLPTRQQEFITLTVLNLTSGEPVILNQLSMVNYTGSGGSTAMGTITIESPHNTSLSNASLTTLLPLSLVSNASHVTTYGIPSNVTFRDGVYYITWYIPYLPANSTTYAYYEVNRPVQSPSPHIQNILAVPSSGQPKLNDILKVYNVTVPIFYTGYTNYVYVHALYVGSSKGIVNLTISASNGVKITNSTRTINVSPNQRVDEQFPVVSPRNMGSMLLTIYISANGASTYYTIPVVIVPHNGTLLTEITGKLHDYTLDVLIAAVVIIVAAVLAAIRRGRRGFTYRKKVTNELSGIKRQIEK